MIVSIMLSGEEKAGLRRYYIDQLWNFVRQHHAEAETENGRLWLIINANQFDAFCDTFCVDDDIINAKIKGRKLHIEARWLVPYAKDPEILAGKELSDENNQAFCADCVVG